MNIYIKESEIENLSFIMDQFIKLHQDNESHACDKDIAFAKRILEKLK
jgi:hypothetical protein